MSMCRKERDHRRELTMIEIREKNEAGLQFVLEKHGNKGRDLGHIVKTENGLWLAIPLHYRNQPTSWHRLRRNAIGALVSPV